ncbi:MAG TPA: M13 family metallopeptidase [Flavipsychrobacter sp.]|nr:M13 family metallopeptidase [Flavipsychrobacter sp.]
MTPRFFLFCAAVLFFSACQQAGSKKEAKQDILKVNTDSTTNPADDFFQYAQGTWIKNNPIPGDQTNWGIGQLVQEELYSRLKTINEEAVKKEAKSGADQQIGDFWFSGMDTVSIEKQGISPLNEELQRINNIKSPQEAMSVASHLHEIGVGVFFGGFVSQDAKKSDRMAYYLYQGGIGLPNRDYYFNNDERTTKVRNAYPGYIATIFTLIGNDSATAKTKAASVISIETKLAKSSRKLEDLRDPYANYNKMAVSQLKNIAPSIEWTKHLEEMGVKGIDSVIVGQPEFYKTLDQIINTENIQTIKDYMAFHLVRNYAPYLSKSFSDANFNFYSKIIRGAQEQKPRWKRVLDAEEDVMGEALGQLFANEYFNEQAKKRYEDIVENVRNAYKFRIEKLDWMTDSTKQKALHKLASIKRKVGYPDKWKDFSTLKIDRGPYVLNVMRGNKWWNDYQMNKLGKPVDRDEWDMTPQTYNAYYNPSNNEIVMPAGIFTVPGYRDEELDDALVYGYAAASTVGHEITHGFDDEGRQFDANGNLQNWWTKKDEEEFTKRAQLLVNQFNDMKPIDTQRINGKATLGENLADLGGILIGLDAFKQTETFKKNEKISGYTPLQRFFLGYALGWMYTIRNEELASRLLTDVHSPAKYRVNGPLPNVPEFYEAFNVKPGNKMYLADSLRVRLW